MRRIQRLQDLPPELQKAVDESRDGIRSNLMCPECGGGRTHEASLSVWRDGSIAVLHCWRNACDYTGNVPVYDDPESVQGTFTPRIFEGRLQRLSGAPARWLNHRYGVWPETSKHWQIKVVTGRKALYMPVYSPHGGERGGMLRYFDGSTPKAISYKHTDDSFQAWYIATETNHVVVIEDQLSAMRCWQLGYTSVALLGTNLNYAKAEEIKFCAMGDQVLLALDKDAFAQACGYVKRYASLMPMRAVLLERDIKDIDDDEIMERLNG